MPENEQSEPITTDNPKLKELQELYHYAKGHDMEKAFRTNNLKHLKYFTGEDQGWDEFGDRAALNKESRPALTLNRIHPLVRLICGARPKSDTNYLPTEDGDIQTAEIMNSCKDHVEDINKWTFLEEDLFKYFVVVNRTVLGIYPNYKKDIRGEIGLQLKDGAKFYLDWDAVEKDRSDGMYQFEEVYLSKKEAMRLWPSKKEKIEELIGKVEHGSEAQSRDVSPTDGYKDEPNAYYNVDTKKLCVVYGWYKDFEKATKLIDTLSGEVYDSPLSKQDAEKELSALGNNGRLKVLERDFTRVKYIIFSNDIIFEEGYNPWERSDGKRTTLSDNFPDVVLEPERLVFGVKQYIIELIEAYEDPQKFHNKLASAVLHIINTQAKGGYDYEEGAISDTELAKLEKEGSKPGHNTKWTKGALANNAVKPRGVAQTPNAEMSMAQVMASELLDVSGIEGMVSSDSLGKNAPAKSREMHYAQGSNSISWLYKSYSFFKVLIAEYIRDAIQMMYDYEKVVRIRGQKNKQITINQQVFDERGGIGQVLNDVSQGAYDTQIRETPADVTQRIERFKFFSEMVKSGELQLPPSVLLQISLRLMDDPELKDIVQEEFDKFSQQQQKSGMSIAQIKEYFDMDKLYPQLSRPEQIQVLQQIGIKPDPNATVTGLPDVNQLIDLEKTKIQSNSKLATTAIQAKSKKESQKQEARQ